MKPTVGGKRGSVVNGAPPQRGQEGPRLGID